jgi:AbrB family looped-hinge helix DNA binding protein
MINEKIEDVVKVSPKGQIVIPKEIRKRLGITTGEKLLVMSRDREILLKKLEALSIEEIGERIERAAKERGIDVDKLISEAVEWARKSKSLTQIFGYQFL